MIEPKSADQGCCGGTGCSPTAGGFSVGASGVLAGFALSSVGCVTAGGSGVSEGVGGAGVSCAGTGVPGTGVPGAGVPGAGVPGAGVSVDFTSGVTAAGVVAAGLAS